jgi:hypothetical protein
MCASTEGRAQTATVVDNSHYRGTTGFPLDRYSGSDYIGDDPDPFIAS